MNEAVQLKERANGAPILVKILKVDSEQRRSQQFKDAFLQEVSIMWFFREHDELVKIMGYSEDPEFVILMRIEKKSLNYDI